MKILLALSILILASCSKDCMICDVVSEDNSREAQRKCSGFANNYPNGYVETSRIPAGELCDDDIQMLRGSTNTTQNTELCDGVFATFRVFLDCRE